MTVDTLRDHLRLQAAFNGCPALLCVIGAKPALAAMREVIDARLLPIAHFDALGVPTEDEMTRCWGSPRGWQKQMAYFWVQTTKWVYRMRPLLVLDGAFDPQFAIAACAANRVRQRVAIVDDGAHPDWVDNAKMLGGVLLDAHATPAQLANTLAAVALELVTST